MNGPSILLKFEFSSLASEQMQNHFAFPPFLSYLNTPLVLQSIQSKICITIDITDYT